MEYKSIAATSQASQGIKELYWLLELLSTIKPKNIVEIGVDRGYSAAVWRKAFPKAKVIGIDINPDLYPDFSDFQYINMDSHSIEAVELVELNMPKIDFLFIDGDHSYEGVKKDYELYAPLVRKGGLVVLHDVNLKGHPLVEVNRFWPEIDEVKQIYGEDHNGYGVVYVSGVK